MNRKVSRICLIFFFLFTLLNAEAGRVRTSCKVKPGKSENSSPMDATQDEDLPGDGEEDSGESREIGEYETDILSASLQLSDPLLNLHYTHHHLLFKEHFVEAVAPPPKI